MTDIHDNSNMNEISAKNTDSTQEAPDPDAVANPNGSDGSYLPDEDGSVEDGQRTYQDNVNNGDNDSDPIIDEETEDPSEELQIPIDEFKEELDKTDLGDHSEHGSEDMRETIEDREEDDDNAASASQ